MKKEYTFEDMVAQVDEEKYKMYLLLHYLLNKNSRPLPQGVDYEKFYDECQDLEQYLLEMSGK